MNLARRFVSGTALIALCIFFIFYADELYFGLVVSAFIGLALYEFFGMLKNSNVPVSPIFGIGMGMTIPAVVLMEYGATQSGEILFLVLGCVFLFILKFFRKSDPESLVGIALTLFGILYVSWFLSFLIKIRFLEGGSIWVAYLLAVTKATDIGAYAVGSLIGKHPLIPHISPKKSVEGTVGGLLTAIAVSCAFRPYLPVEFALHHVAILGLFLGVLGQIGDLSESMMKRFCHTKDSSKLLPGMGGVMDVADSILFTAPIFFFHLKIYL